MNDTTSLFTDEENTAVGLAFATVVTGLVTVPVVPSLSVTVSVTLYVVTAGKVWLGLADVLVGLPSPKSHR